MTYLIALSYIGLIVLVMLSLAFIIQSWVKKVQAYQHNKEHIATVGFHLPYVLLLILAGASTWMVLAGAARTEGNMQPQTRSALAEEREQKEAGKIKEDDSRLKRKEEPAGEEPPAEPAK